MTKTDQHASRREIRHTQVQRRRVVRIAALGALVVVVAVGVAAVVLTMNGSSNGNKSGATTWTVPAYSGGPRLAVDRTLVDEGPVAYGQKVAASYRLKNVGDKPLTLQAPTVEIVEGC